MARWVDVSLRWLVLATWLAAIVAITQDGNLQALLAFGLCVAAGALVGRWWALAAPWLAGLGFFAVGLLSGGAHCSGCVDPIPPWGGALLLLALAVFADVGLGIGALLNKAVRHAPPGARSGRPGRRTDGGRGRAHLA